MNYGMIGISAAHFQMPNGIVMGTDYYRYTTRCLCCVVHLVSSNGKYYEKCLQIRTGTVNVHRIVVDVTSARHCGNVINDTKSGPTSEL